MRTSLRWPIWLGVVMIVLVVALIVAWIVLTATRIDSRGLSWTLLTVGTLFLILVLVGVVLYLLLSVKEIRLNQRQANFVASVSHELKSPIASLKLYLQTLDRRKVTEAQQVDFHRFMLEDVERLDTLIDHLLDAARLDQVPVEAEVADVDLAAVLRNCAQTARARYRLGEDVIQLELDAATVRARAIDIEMIFRNLIDNAIKYGGSQPQVQVTSRSNGRGRVTTQIIDNGCGIPAKLRRKIFGRFVRLGNELQRSRSGTGLGLFIVRTLVKRLRGTISVRGRIHEDGTIFEVQLPAVVGEAATPD